MQVTQRSPRMQAFVDSMYLITEAPLPARLLIAAELRRERTTTVQGYADMAFRVRRQTADSDSVLGAVDVDDARHRYYEVLYYASSDKPRSEAKGTDSKQSESTVSADDSTSVTTDASEETESVAEAPDVDIDDIAKKAYAIRGRSEDYDSVSMSTTVEDAVRVYQGMLRGEVSQSPTAEPLASKEHAVGDKGASNSRAVVVLLCILTAGVLSALATVYLRTTKRESSMTNDVTEEIITTTSTGPMGHLQ